MSDPYYSMIEKMPVAVYTCNLEGEITFYNGAAVELWGRKPQKHKDRWCGSLKRYNKKGNFVPHEDCPIAKLCTHKENGKMSPCEMMIERPDGTKRFVLPFPNRIYNSFGQLSGIINTLIDITEQVNTRKKIEESEQSFNVMLIKSPFGFAVQKGPEMVVEFANDSIKKIWEKGKNIEGKSLLEFLPELKDQSFLEILQHVMYSGVPYYGYEIYALIKRKEKVEDCYFNFVYQPFYQVGNYISGATTIVLEVTKEVMAKKRIEESEKKYRALSASLEDEVGKRTLELAKQNHQLAILNKDLELFAHISLHDLQEPLRKAKMAFSRISNDDLNALTENGKGHIQKANTALDAMQVLIDDLHIYWSSVQSNKVFEYTDMDFLVAEVLDGLSLQIEENNATITSTPLGHCSVIRFQFRQVLHNLLSNALKFSKPGNPPTVEVKSKVINGQELNIPKLINNTKYYNLCISDNGIGFDIKYEEKIFEVFQRLHGKDRYKGTGIGLAIVKKIIDQHHGFIKVSSEKSNGATFNLYIPTI